MIAHYKGCVWDLIHTSAGNHSPSPSMPHLTCQSGLLPAGIRLDLILPTVKASGNIILGNSR